MFDYSRTYGMILELQMDLSIRIDNKFRCKFIYIFIIKYRNIKYKNCDWNQVSCASWQKEFSISLLFPSHRRNSWSIYSFGGLFPIIVNYYNSNKIPTKSLFLFHFFCVFDNKVISVTVSISIVIHLEIFYINLSYKFYWTWDKKIKTNFGINRFWIQKIWLKILINKVGLQKSRVRKILVDKFVVWKSFGWNKYLDENNFVCKKVG